MAEALEIGLATVQRLRRCFVEEGLAVALSPYRGSKRVCATKLDGEQEAGLIALACSTPPEGHGRRTLRLLAWMWRIPAQHSAALIARMRTCLRSTAEPMTPNGRWSVWTRPAGSSSAR
jgi:hypothetical protein